MIENGVNPEALAVSFSYLKKKICLFYNVPFQSPAPEWAE